MRLPHLLCILILAALSAVSCGGCDEAAPAGAPDGSACAHNDDCRGDCVDGACANDPDPNNANNAMANNATANNATANNATANNATANNATANNATANNATANNANNVTAGPPVPSGTMYCDGEPCACDDGLDNDGDGLFDGQDAECTGPYDDDEGSFATGLPGDNIDFCQDCFFDGNSGHGDDFCEYHTDCLYGEEPPGAGGAGCFSCDVSTTCVNNCRPRTPNGCDCFGCCGVQHPDTGETINVLLDPACTVDNLDDEQACPRCVQSTQCVNECGRCELCPGKTAADLPADCTTSGGGGTGADGDPCVDNSECQNLCQNGVCGGGGGSGNTCDDGEVVCAGSGDCPNNHYCAQGCCLVVLD